MAGVAVDGAYCSGHACWPPRQNVSGSCSTDVFAEGSGVIRLGDAWNIHVCDDDVHAGIVNAGSGSVFVNGKPVARIGDAIDCGSIIARGCATVHAGGAGGGGSIGVSGVF